MCGVLCFVCACGVCGVWVVCVHVVLCRRACCVYMWCCVGVGDVLCGCCVLCGLWCVVLCRCVGGVLCVFVFLCCFAFFSSILFFLFLALSSLFFPSSLVSLLSSLFSSSSLLFPFTPTNTVQSTDQQNWRPTSRHLNVIWRTAGAQQSVVSPPLHSLLPSLPLLLLKKRRELFITGICPARNLFFITVSN